MDLVFTLDVDFSSDFQERGDDASPAEGQSGHGDPRDAESLPQCRIRGRSDSHVSDRSILYILYANSRIVGIRAVQEEEGAVHDVSGDRGSRPARRACVSEAVFQILFVSALFPSPLSVFQ